MKITFKGFTEHALFALNIFIIFLLIFGKQISVPLWLQSFGRMHPMLLHFPIVLLLLAMLLEIFRYNNSVPSKGEIEWKKGDAMAFALVAW